MHAGFTAHQSQVRFISTDPRAHLGCNPAYLNPCNPIRPTGVSDGRTCWVILVESPGDEEGQSVEERAFHAEHLPVQFPSVGSKPLHRERLGTRARRDAGGIARPQANGHRTPAAIPQSTQQELSDGVASRNISVGDCDEFDVVLTQRHDCIGGAEFVVASSRNGNQSMLGFIARRRILEVVDEDHHVVQPLHGPLHGLDIIDPATPDRRCETTRLRRPQPGRRRPPAGRAHVSLPDPVGHRDAAPRSANTAGQTTQLRPERHAPGGEHRY